MGLTRKSKTFVYHISTRNISFLQTAKDLKSLGIKNNMFFLKLYDKDLEFIDPFSPNLTGELKIKIINECIINPYYFLRECVRIPDQGANGVAYQLHRANLAATYCFLNGLDHYLVIPRQTGKTMSTISILMWAFQFGTTNSEFMFINKRQEDANNNLFRLKQQRDILPSFMRMKEIINDDGKLQKGGDNVQSTTNPATNNKIVTKPKANSVEAAEGIGRGCTQPIQFFDEVEFTPHIKTIVEAAGPAYNTASSNAKRNNASYCRIFVSTPGDLDTRSGSEALEIIDKTCKWTEQFYDWDIPDIEAYIKKSSENGIIYIEYSYQQLGYDEEWFQGACQSLLNNPIKIKREIFLKRMRGSSESPFEQEELEAVADLKGKVISEIFINKLFKLDIYEELKRDRVYIIGVDCAQGLGGDSTAVTIIDPYTVRPVAEFKSPYIGVSDAVKFLHILVRKHVPKSILAIERNNVGEAIMDGLRQTSTRNNLYFDNTKNPIVIDDKLDANGFLQREAHNRKLYGVWTGKESRSIMMSLLEAHMYDFKEKFVTENIINDLFGLVRKKSGRIEHGPTKHDDSLFSYLIGLYVYYHGKNLHRFGFVRGELPEDEKRNRGLTYEELYEELPEELKEDFADFSVQTVADYQRNIKKEIEDARRSSQSITNMLNPINSVSNYDSDDEYAQEVSLDLFDELNDW